MRFDQILFLQSISKNSNENFIIYNHKFFTYLDIENLVAKFSFALKNLNLKSGDFIFIALPRIPQLIITFLASMRIGTIIVPINPIEKYEKLKGIISTIPPSIFVITSNYLEKFYNICKDIGLKKVKIICVDRNIKSFFYFDNLVNKSKRSLKPVPISTNPIAYLNFTSGSTGIPKAAVTTHSNLLWNTISMVKHFKLNDKDVHLPLFSPFAHPHEIFCRALMTGGKIVVTENIYPRKIFKLIESYEVTAIMAVSSIYQLFREYLKRFKSELKSLRLIESGGMPTPISLNLDYERAIGKRIIPVWGSTETTGVAIANKIEDDFPLDSVGKVCPFYQAKLIDQFGKVNKEGELLIKGKGVVKAYYDSLKMTKNSFKNGWYFTKDLFKIDSNGYFYFVDRKDRMLKVKGMKVYAREVEEILYSHSKIDEVYLVPYLHKLKGESYVALIKTKKNVSINEKGLRRYLTQYLPEYKIPIHFIIIENIPKLPNGKYDILKCKKLVLDLLGGKVEK